MSSTEAARGFDLDEFRRSTEERDAAGLRALYAEDAEIRLIDQNNPPSHPLVLRGRDQIGAYLDDVCGREMTHEIQHAVTDGVTVNFFESCRYPDGTRVLCAATLDLADGRIIRETGVQAWDQ
ncbi:SnoaL-like domain [Nocardia otitidiscaviarum]|uniref:Nuclear transport factor 2 family protein n=1 Tax=Nocardia otitidiscaviarum TaxID=1823 RepID=A0A378YUH2_9NOCA|nr:nuclear transport factor 2 family protein [Nocardia otitidiscaviarum]MBF6181200.1 nuclear transport factor 2 family protein [Nocardia otitidiscaviarum]MCP9619437.1 nuclear transport factor 2 family protein [Nocardia otitidiscaviarum]QDP80375.1 nuclear transport factor 2 family protein [Nocardia otitidiscaviarum]SUA80458.1 SnoaL-like domain [Nocardia otitidiscaviarum]